MEDYSARKSTTDEHKNILMTLENRAKKGHLNLSKRRVTQQVHIVWLHLYEVLE